MSDNLIVGEPSAAGVSCPPVISFQHLTNYIMGAPCQLVTPS